MVSRGATGIAKEGIVRSPAYLLLRCGRFEVSPSLVLPDEGKESLLGSTGSHRLAKSVSLRTSIPAISFRMGMVSESLTIGSNSRRNRAGRAEMVYLVVAGNASSRETRRR
jgi:hypothetical protein